MIRIDVEAALRGLRDVIAEKGADTVYDEPELDGCVYVLNGAPSCLVGHVLVRCGVPLRVFDKWQNESGVLTLRLTGVEITTQARAVLTAAQDEQDAGGTWGRALELAELTAAEFNMDDSLGGES